MSECVEGVVPVEGVSAEAVMLIEHQNRYAGMVLRKAETLLSSGTDGGASLVSASEFVEYVADLLAVEFWRGLHIGQRSTSPEFEISGALKQVLSLTPEDVANGKRC